MGIEKLLNPKVLIALLSFALICVFGIILIGMVASVLDSELVTIAAGTFIVAIMLLFGGGLMIYSKKGKNKILCLTALSRKIGIKVYFDLMKCHEK